MVEKAFIYATIALLLAGAFFIGFYSTKTEGVSFCDSKTLLTGAEPVCYEEPILNSNNFRNGRIIKPIKLEVKR